MKYGYYLVGLALASALAWGTIERGNLLVKGTLGVTGATTLSTALGATSGGTGQSTYTTGDILYASATNTLSKLAAGTSGYVLTANGAGVAPTFAAATGGTGVNFITNAGAETDTSGWLTYSDTPGAVPIDGIDGGPSVTLTRTTSSPLTNTASFLFTHAASNYQGQGASYPFTIDTASQAKVLSIEFDYIVDSGTFVAGSPGVDSDMEIYVYDIDNSVIIQPSTYKLFSSSSTVPAHFVGNFQTNSNATHYRLIFHTATTTASAYTLKFDTVLVGPSKYVYGTPITDWKAFTPTGTFIANTTYTGFWRRVGDAMEIQYHLAFAGAPTSTTLTLNMPTGYTIDTGKLSAQINNVVGSGSLGDTGTLLYDVNIGYSTSTVLAVYAKTTSSNFATETGVTQISPFTIGNTDVLDAIVKVPIVGWSSAVQMSDNADQRVIAASATGNPASATAFNPIIVPTVGYDTHGAYDATTGRFTCPVPGIYKVYGALLSASSATSLHIYKNGSADVLVGNLDSNGESTFTGAIKTNAGDVIDLRPDGTVDASAMTLSFEKISGPESISATESIAARYYASATSLSGSLATIVWSTKDFDTHGAVASGVFTVPAPGKYHTTCALGISGTIVLNNQQIIEIQKNGTAVKNVTHYSAGAQTAADIEISDDVNAVAGDTIRCQASSGSTGPAIVSSNTKNVFAIYRVGL